MADRRDEVDHRVSEDRSAGFDLAQLRGAYPGERPDDSDKVLIGPVAREIFGLLAARLPDVAPPKCLSKYLRLFQRDWPPPDVAPAARPVSQPSLREPRLASPRSDVRQDALSPQAARTESQQGAPERHSEKHLEALPSFPQVVAGEQLVLQAFRAMQQPLAQPVSARLEPLQEPPLEPDASS